MAGMKPHIQHRKFEPSFIDREVLHKKLGVLFFAVGFLVGIGFATFVNEARASGMTANAQYNPASVAITGGTIGPAITGGAGLVPTNATNAINVVGSGTISSMTTGGASLTPNSAYYASVSTLQPTGTANTYIATTSFVNPGSSLTANGYRKNPDGSIEQWGTCVSVTNSAASCIVTFPIAFTSAIFLVLGTPRDDGGAGAALGGVSEHAPSRSLNGTALNVVGLNGAFWNAGVNWFAIGR